jgi:adenine deaminase
MIFKAGRLVAENGKVIVPVKRDHHRETKNSVRMRPVSERDIALRVMSDRVRVIELVPGRIETKLTILRPAVQDSHVSADTERDIVKIVVIERHRATGNIGIGLVKGFGLKAGALASTVAHDSHNVIAVGVSDRDIIAAVQAVGKMHGGLAAVRDGKLLAGLPLPIAGLMSDRPAHVVAGKLQEIEKAARGLGSTLEHPFGALSFLALPVVPELKITDQGLVDVNRHCLTELFV